MITEEKPLKVLLVDFFSKGHHIDYACDLVEWLKNHGQEVEVMGHPDLTRAIEDIYCIQCHPVPCDILGTLGSGLRLELQKIRLLNMVSTKAKYKQYDVIHLLDADRFLSGLFILSHLQKIKFTQWCSTLHWVPFIEKTERQLFLDAKIKLLGYILARLLKSGMRVTVHSKKQESLLRKKTRSEGIYAIPYPIKFKSIESDERYRKRQAFRISLNIKENHKILLCFGGTRHDKGADSAIHVLPLLNRNCRLLIAGQEEHFKKDYLTNIADKLGVLDQVILCLKHIPDQMVPDLFYASDIVLLPYRHGFSGQSGPLAIGASLGIPVVASACTVLEESIKEYAIGNTFPHENIQEMAESIKSSLEQNITEYATLRFREEHSLAAFGKSVFRCYRSAAS